MVDDAWQFLHRGPEMSPRQALGEGFRHVFGRFPEGIWSAPGRVNLIGEFTDYNDGYRACRSLFPSPLDGVRRSSRRRSRASRLRPTFRER